ncbi:MAG: formylglycine-generating enzyme family protein, partial [Planctomycetota bacterium]
DPNDGQQIELTVDRERKLLQLEKSGFKIATTRFVLSGKDGQTVSVTFEPKAVMEEASDLSQASGPRGKPLHTNAIGFTVDAVQTHVDNDSMRLRTWNDTENLFVQAILWKDNDDRFGRSEDQETNNDRSTLLIDVDLDRQRTSGSDRFYWLTRTPSSHKMRYQVVTGPTRSTYLRSDSRAYGQIRYHSVNDKPRVRVDTYVIPLNEIGISPGEKIGIAYWGCSPLPALVVNSVGFVPKKEEMYYPADLPWEEFHEVHLQRVENDRDVASASTNLEPAGEESSSTPRVPEVVLSPSVTTSSMSELVQNGVAGFSASEAQALVETESLRLHTCHDGTNLVVQAILWQDDDETFGKSNDPLLSQKRLADRSMLVFDVDSNRRLTPGIDRKYYLDWSQRFRGMLYQVRGTTGYYVFKRDSEGYGAIQYFETGSDRKVRVDTYVIPLKEIGVAPGEVIGVGFAAGSISPKLEIKSTVADSLVNESTSLDQLGFESLHQVRLQRKDADPLQITEQIWPRDQPAPAIVPFTAEEAKEHQEAWARHLQVPVGFKNSIGMRFRVIPPGEFLMGSSEAEIAKLTEETKDKSRSDWYAERLPSEGPQRKVVLSKPFALAVHEVSRGQFRKFVVATGYKTEGEKDGRGGAGFTNGILRLRAPEFLWNTDLGFETEPNDDHPVVNISWEDATAFCDWLSEKEGVRCRLPTEAEWEFACRAGSLARFHAGNDEAEVREFAWIENEGGVGTHPVGTKTANAFGLFDLHGNVWEWCGEKFGRYNPTEVVDPVGPLIGELRVLRGGAFSKDAAFARSAYRTHIIPDYRDCSCGFRVVRTFESFP